MGVNCEVFSSDYNSSKIAHNELKNLQNGSENNTWMTILLESVEKPDDFISPHCVKKRFEPLWKENRWHFLANWIRMSKTWSEDNLGYETVNLTEQNCVKLPWYC